MEEKKEVRFEAEPKLEIVDLKEVIANTSNFDEPEKAEAIIKNLKLSVGDVLKENDDYYTINPRMVLEGEPPEHYKKTIENLKRILTEQEIKAISQLIAMRETKSYDKKRDKVYYAITKRIDKFYFRGNIKKSISQEVKEVLEFFKNNNHPGINNTIYHLLSKDKQDYITCYKCAWKNKPIPNIQKWNERTDGEYRVLTDSEADREARNYLEDDEYMWIEAVKSKNTTSSFNDWVDEVINMDGRASLLSGYDGSENSEDINGTTYYIYRTN